MNVLAYNDSGEIVYIKDMLRTDFYACLTSKNMYKGMRIFPVIRICEPFVLQHPTIVNVIQYDKRSHRIASHSYLLELGHILDFNRGLQIYPENILQSDVCIPSKFEYSGETTFMKLPMWCSGDAVNSLVVKAV